MPLADDTKEYLGLTMLTFPELKMWKTHAGASLAYSW